jgi:hypothetical protein
MFLFFQKSINQKRKNIICWKSASCSLLINFNNSYVTVVFAIQKLSLKKLGKISIFLFNMQTQSYLFFAQNKFLLICETV